MAASDGDGKEDDSPRSVDGLNLYALLNLPKDAEAHDIEKRSKQLLRIFHPDKAIAASQQDAQQAFVEIVFASEVLLDPVLRAVYDFGGILAVRLVNQQGEAYSILEDLFSRGNHRTFYSELHSLLDDYLEKQKSNEKQHSSLEVSSKVPFIYDDTSDWFLLPDHEDDDTSFLNVSYSYPFSNRLTVGTRLAALPDASMLTAEYRPVAGTTVSTTISPRHSVLRTTRRLSMGTFVSVTAVWQSALRLSLQSVKALEHCVVTYGCDVVARRSIALLSLTIRSLSTAPLLQGRIRLAAKSPVKLWWESTAGFLVSVAGQWDGSLRWKFMQSLPTVLDRYEIDWGFKLDYRGVTLLLQFDTSKGFSIQLPFALYKQPSSLLAWTLPALWLTNWTHQQVMAPFIYTTLRKWTSHETPGAQPTRMLHNVQFQRMLRTVSHRREAQRLSILRGTLDSRKEDVTSFLQLWVVDGELRLDRDDPRWNWIGPAQSDDDGDDDELPWDLWSWHSEKQEDSPIREDRYLSIRYELDGKIYQVVCSGDVFLPAAGALKIGDVVR